MTVALVLAVVAACHRPSLVDRGRALGDKVASVARPAARVGVDVVAAAKRTIDAHVDATLDAAVARVEPVTIEKKVTRPAGARTPSRAGRVADDPVAPAATVTRVDASRPTTFVLRGTTHGGAPYCEAYRSGDECTARCTEIQRAAALRATAPDGAAPAAAAPRECTGCTELDRGC